MHSSGGERSEEEQLTQLGRAERRVRSWSLTEKRLLTRKQCMARGVEREMAAVVMGMLLNSCRTKSSSVVASERHCSWGNILCQQHFRWVVYARAMPTSPPPPSLAQSCEGTRDEGTGVEIYTQRRSESSRTDRVEARKRYTESEVRDPEHHAYICADGE
jgi:hypothetical protein